MYPWKTGIMKHKELVEAAATWLKKKSCGVVLQEYNYGGIEVPDVIGFWKDGSILVECKVSRPDFFRDRLKEGRNRGSNHLGNRRYYFVPKGLLSPEDIPDGWGLVYPGEKRVTIAKKAPLHSEPEIKVAENIILFSLARRATIRGYLPHLTETINGAY